MKIDNVEKLRRDIENTITSIFYNTDTTIEKISTIKGVEIIRPTVIRKNERPFIAIEVCEDQFRLWKYENETYKSYQRMDFRFYKNKTILIADLVKQIMSADKYCTLY